MVNHSEIVRRGGKPETLAERCGVSVNTVRSWIIRNSIPSEYWLAFTAADLATLDELAEAAARRKA